MGFNSAFKGLKNLIQLEHRQTEDGLLIYLTTLFVSSNDETVKDELGQMRKLRSGGLF